MNFKSRMEIEHICTCLMRLDLKYRSLKNAKAVTAQTLTNSEWFHKVCT
jgi:hypothetical protein